MPGYKETQDAATDAGCLTNSMHTFYGTMVAPSCTWSGSVSYVQTSLDRRQTMKSTDSEGSHISTHFHEFSVYMEALQVHMLKWLPSKDITRNQKRVELGTRYENRNLFKSV